MLKKLLLPTLLLTFIVFPAFAEIVPENGKADARVKFVTYSEHDVYRLQGHYGFTSTIEFSPDERIETISVGDSTSWQISKPARPNILFAKPLAENAHTNMTILTSLRSYNFELNANPSSSDTEEQTFLLKFKYKDLISSAAKKKKTKLETLSMPESKSTGWNFEYSYAGARILRPKQAFDDGKFTYFKFNSSRTLPAIFSVDSKGNEALVNFSVDNSYVIIRKVDRQFTLRDGDIETCIFNDAFDAPSGIERIAKPIKEIKEDRVLRPKRKPGRGLYSLLNIFKASSQYSTKTSHTLNH